MWWLLRLFVVIVDETCVFQEDFCEFIINIDDISVDTSKIKSAEIKITDDIGMKMNFPQLEIVQKYSSGIDGEEIKSENIFNIKIVCSENQC